MSYWNCYFRSYDLQQYPGTVVLRRFEAWRDDALKATVIGDG
jgi:hypothetical protein